MATAVVTNTLKAPDGSVLTDLDVRIRLYPYNVQGYDPSGNEIDGTVYPTAINGAWSASLERTDTMTPPGMQYEVSETSEKARIANRKYIVVPGAGPFPMNTVLSSSLLTPAQFLVAGPPGPVGDVGAVFALKGIVSAIVGQNRWYATKARTITAVLASVGTAPTGASLIVDVKKNGTTIFTTASNRPTIVAGGFSAYAAGIDVPAMALNDYLTVDVDQVGSTTQGSDLTVQIITG